MTEPFHPNDSHAGVADAAQPQGIESEAIEPRTATAVPVDRLAPPPTDGQVAVAVRRLDELEGRPPAEHVEVYEAVHRGLQESLAEASGEGDRSGGAP